MISIEHLTKTYTGINNRKLKALDEISISCPPARISGLLGPNGAGKTTTLRILATLIKPTAGKVFVAGLDVTKDLHRVRRKIGFLSGLTHLYGRLSTHELMDYFCTFYKVEKEVALKQKKYLFEVLDINNFSDRAIDKLSTGQRQRVNIARTLIHDPDVIILDEPTLGLDLFAKKSIFDVMRLYREQGKTILFSSHDIFEIQELCDQVSILHQGRILYEGTTDSALALTNTQRLDDAFMQFIDTDTNRY